MTRFFRTFFIILRSFLKNLTSLKHFNDSARGKEDASRLVCGDCPNHFAAVLLGVFWRRTARPLESRRKGNVLIHLTDEYVHSVSPDERTFEKAQDLAKKSPRCEGASYRALWGEFQGSAATPYFTMVDIRDSLAYRCSCPSRKLPCKHVLALMLRRAAEPYYTDDEPQSVVEWLAARDERLEKKKTSAAATPAPENDAAESAAPKPRASSKREARVDAGVELIQTQLEDMMRLGLGSSEVNSPGFWDRLSRRMVDAQTPGLLRFISGGRWLLNRGEAGREQLLNQLGKLALLLEAYRRIDDAPEDFASEIRQALGYTVPQADVLASGERVEGAWLALGRKVVEAQVGKLFVACDWFMNLETGRFAHFLQFFHAASADEARFPERFSASSLYKGAMRYWPGTLRLRALFESRPESIETTTVFRLKTSLDKFFRRIPDYQARAPWIQTIPAFLDDVVVRPYLRFDGSTRKREWRVVSSSGLSAPARSLDGWDSTLVEYCCATWRTPRSLFAEWNGREFVVFSLWNGQKIFNAREAYPPSVSSLGLC